MPSPDLLIGFPAVPETDRLKTATIGAAVMSMRVIQRHQMGNTIVMLPDKADSSRLTITDLESEQAAGQELQRLAPGVPVLGEEYGLSSRAVGRYIFLHDPIDGTRPFSGQAPTPTTISGLHDYESGQIQAVTTGEPSTGRLWYSNGQKTYRGWLDPTNPIIDGVQECQVWEGSHADNGMVLIDNLRAFSRAQPNGASKLIMSNPNLLSLLGTLQVNNVNVQNYGSNGLHHALVANGGEGVAGAITTAMGGPWDTAGALAVLTAGGVAEGFRVTDDRRLESADPFDPFAYDICVSASNPKTLDFLRDSLHRAMSVNQ